MMDGAFVHDLEELAARVVVEELRPEIVDDQKLRFPDRIRLMLRFFRILERTGLRKQVEELYGREIQDRVAGIEQFLRDAAGQLIENVTKSVRRKTEVDEAYIDKLYEDVNSLYHLDQTSAAGSSKTEFGPLPAESKALIFGLIGVWLIIIIYNIDKFLTHKRKL